MKLIQPSAPGRKPSWEKDASLGLMPQASMMARRHSQVQLRDPEEAKTRVEENRVEERGAEATEDTRNSLQSSLGVFSNRLSNSRHVTADFIETLEQAANKLETDESVKLAAKTLDKVREAFSALTRLENVFGDDSEEVKPMRTQLVSLLQDPERLMTDRAFATRIHRSLEPISRLDTLFTEIRTTFKINDKNPVVIADLNAKFLKWMSDAAETLTSDDTLLYKTLMNDLKALDQTIKRQAKWYVKDDLDGVENVLWTPSMGTKLDAHFDEMRTNVKRLDAVRQKGFLDPKQKYAEVKALAADTGKFDKMLTNEVCAYITSLITKLTQNVELDDAEREMKERLNKPKNANLLATLGSWKCTTLDDAMESMEKINKLRSRKLSKKQTESKQAARERKQERAEKVKNVKETKKKARIEKETVRDFERVLKERDETEIAQEINKFQKELQEEEEKVAARKATKEQRLEHIDEIFKEITQPNYIFTTYKEREPIRVVPHGNVRELQKDIKGAFASVPNVKRLRLFDRVLTYYLFSFDGTYPGTDELMTEFVDEALTKVGAPSDFNFNGNVGKTPDFRNITESERIDLQWDLRNGLPMYQNRKSENDSRLLDFLAFANAPESKPFRISQLENSRYDKLKEQFWKAEQAQDDNLKNFTKTQIEKYMAPIDLNMGVARRLQLFDRVVDYYVTRYPESDFPATDSALQRFIYAALKAVEKSQVVIRRNGTKLSGTMSSFTNITPSEKENLKADLIASLHKYEAIKSAKLRADDEALKAVEERFKAAEEALRVAKEELNAEELKVAEPESFNAEERKVEPESLAAAIERKIKAVFPDIGADITEPLISDELHSDGVNVIRTLYKFLLENPSITQEDIESKVDEWATKKKVDWFGIKPGLNFIQKKTKEGRFFRLIPALKQKLREYLEKPGVAGRESPNYNDLLEWLVIQLASRMDREDMLPVVHDMMDNPSITSLKFLFDPKSRGRAERDLKKLDALLRVDPNPAVLSRLLGVVGTPDFARAMKTISRE